MCRICVRSYKLSFQNFILSKYVCSKTWKQIQAFRMCDSGPNLKSVCEPLILATLKSVCVIPSAAKNRKVRPLLLSFLAYCKDGIGAKNMQTGNIQKEWNFFFRSFWKYPKKCSYASVSCAFIRLSHTFSTHRHCIPCLLFHTSCRMCDSGPNLKMC